MQDQNPTPAALPPLMPLIVFFQLFGISKALYYKLPPEKRPRVVRVGCKPMIRAADAMEWAENLPES